MQTGVQGPTNPGEGIGGQRLLPCLSHRELGFRSMIYPRVYAVNVELRGFRATSRWRTEQIQHLNYTLPFCAPGLFWQTRYLENDGHNLPCDVLFQQ